MLIRSAKGPVLGLILAGSSLMGASGCESAPGKKLADSPAKAPVAPAETKPDAKPLQAELPIHRAERKLMGTIWAVTIAGGEAEPARIAASKALDEVARLETLLSEWQPDSEISRVNKAAGQAPVKVGPELVACVKASLEIARWSDGAFDISWAALRDLWDFSADSPGVPPNPEALKRRLPLWNYRNIVLDEGKSTVFLKKAGMQIGLGGVAKGYALDRAGEILLSAGFQNYMMYAGGQVLVHGKKGDRLWRVGIQHPREPRHFAYVEVTDASLATSGDYEHTFEFEGKRYHHIIDPKTGYPSEKTASVTVVAPTALWADAVDTAIFIMGPDAGMRAIAKAPGGPIEAAIVDPTLHLTATEGLKPRIILTAEVAADGLIGRPIEGAISRDPKPWVSPPSQPPEGAH